MSPTPRTAPKRSTPALGPNILKAIGALAVLFLILFLVMGWWGDYRAGDAPPEESVETTASPEATTTPEGEGGTEEPASGDAEAPVTTAQVVVLVDGLNFRTGASRDAALIRGLDEGERLTYLGTESGWYKVRADDGTVGYVSSSEQYARLEK